jgi:ribosomal protein S3
MEKTGIFAAPLTKRKARSRTEWLKEVRSFHDSGLRIEEYAARKGLVLNRLIFWMRTLRKDVETRTKSAVPAFLPVSVRQVPAPAASARMMAEIDLPNGRRVRVHVKTDADFSRISELLDAVEGGNRC